MKKIRQRIGILFVVVTALLAAGCRNPGIVQISPNIYMLSREDHAGIFGSMSKLKAGVISDADAFAEKRGKVAIPLSAKEHQVGTLGDWASFEVTFKLVDTSDPMVNAASIWTSSSLEGGQGWRNLGGKATVYPAQEVSSDGNKVQSPTIGQQLIDLKKAKDAGAITDAEYQEQKAKLLQSN
jgi:hypothetical protein